MEALPQGPVTEHRARFGWFYPAPGRAQAVGRLARFPAQPSFPRRELAGDSAARTVQSGGGRLDTKPAGGRKRPPPPSRPPASARRSWGGAWRGHPGGRHRFMEEKTEA